MRAFFHISLFDIVSFIAGVFISFGKISTAIIAAKTDAVGIGSVFASPGSGYEIFSFRFFHYAIGKTRFLSEPLASSDSVKLKQTSIRDR
jgi:hypothetical protein